MNNLQLALESIRIVRPPKQHLATFGSTMLHYVLLSTPEGQAQTCRVREGTVMADRPQILTPELMKERFTGFGEEAESYAEHMSRLYGASLRALEYRFRNDLQSTTLEQAPIKELIERVNGRLDEQKAMRTGLLIGHDTHWSLAVMKFIIDSTLQSLPSNMQELQDRGMFNPDQRREVQVRRHIEKLFVQAAQDKTHIKELGEALRSAGLFGEYEDRFFGLVKT